MIRNSREEIIEVYRSRGNVFFWRGINHSSLCKYNCEYTYFLSLQILNNFSKRKDAFSSLSSIVIRSSVIFHLSRQIIRRLPVPRGAEQNAINHINHKLVPWYNADAWFQIPGSNSIELLPCTPCVLYIYWDNKPQLWPSLTNRSPFSLFFSLPFVAETKEKMIRWTEETSFLRTIFRFSFFLLFFLSRRIKNYRNFSFFSTSAPFLKFDERRYP